MSRYEEVISRLEAAGSHRRGNNWQCPAHDDKRPSLSVNIAEDGSGMVLMKCHAGCTIQEITVALGITPAFLFPVNGHQTALFPVSKYSPIGIDVIRKTPPSAHRTLHVAAALGRYVDRWGGRTEVKSTRQMLCVVLERRHRRAVREYLGLTQGGLRNDIMRWREWAVAHACPNGMITILVRESEQCPLCKASLVGDGTDAKASSIGDGSTPLASSNGDALGTDIEQPLSGSLKGYVAQVPWMELYPEGDGAPDRSRR